MAVIAGYAEDAQAPEADGKRLVEFFAETRTAPNDSASPLRCGAVSAEFSRLERHLRPHPGSTLTKSKAEDRDAYSAGASRARLSPEGGLTPTCQIHRSSIGDRNYLEMPYDHLTDSTLADDFWTIRIISHWLGWRAPHSAPGIGGDGL
jgi:hypothetical protein